MTYLQQSPGENVIPAYVYDTIPVDWRFSLLMARSSLLNIQQETEMCSDLIFIGESFKVHVLCRLGYDWK